ncbi:MAG: hypothetical protein H6626_09840 [Pseudobdellovibrionaceae bacterium]|nr:hypothetical protein [Bdellovibrionales bacterium]USN46515.1 MAG: hypothetical protein H6626_09840 [Pseudobdellovibrionaceae bacterium]
MQVLTSFLPFIFWLALLGYGEGTLATPGLMNVCDPHELSTKNCHIQMGTYQLHVREKKIHINNGTWRAVENMPDLGEKVEWAGVQLRKMGQRSFVEVQAWDTPSNEASISSLHWMVFELQGVKWLQKLDKIVQKRRKLQDGQYSYDKKSDFGLRPHSKANQIHWYMSDEKGKF